MSRVIFPRGQQRKLILAVCGGKSLRKFWDENKKLLGVSYSTFKGYAAERRTIPLQLLNKFNEFNKFAKQLEVEILPRNWGQVKGGKKGIRVLFQKYGEKQFAEWRRQGGINSGEAHLKSFNRPEALNGELAEFLGAYLGDGTLTKYFIRITGDKRYDKSYFKYLSLLAQNIFGVEAAIREETGRNQLYLELRSKLLCDFMRKQFNLQSGDKMKNGNTVPPEILSNKEFSAACLRGLVDTDGCISKDGKTFSIRFSSGSKPLLDCAEKIGKELGVFTFRTSREVGTRSWEKVEEYFRVVGSSNLRHITRFCEYVNGNAVYKKDVLNYYSRYNDLQLPFVGPVVDKITESQTK